MLLQKGRVDANAKAPDGATALHFAAAAGHVKVVALLIENGAKVNSPKAHSSHS